MAKSESTPTPLDIVGLFCHLKVGDQSKHGRVLGVLGDHYAYLVELFDTEGKAMEITLIPRGMMTEHAKLFRTMPSLPSVK